MNIYYIDGEYVRADKAMIPVDDLIVLRGYGIFDFLRTYGGKPFFLKEHIERLRRSAEQVSMFFPWSDRELKDIVLSTLQRNNFSESNIRVVITGGSSSDFITPPDKPRLLVLVTPLPQIPEWWYKKGVKIITFTAIRTIPGVKSINYIMATMAMADAVKNGGVEAVYINKDNQVLEGTTSNIFAIFGSKLVTPGTRILPGVTRKIVLDIAKEICEINIRDLTRNELIRADELFITSSNKEVVPVVQVDHDIIADGKPGKKTRQLKQMYSQFTQNY